ncbi:hypothetical protein NKG94_20680 [Micromonospora sp. M12]
MAGIGQDGQVAGSRPPTRRWAMRVRGRLTCERRTRAGALLTALLAAVVPPAVLLGPGAATASAAAAGTPVCQVRDDRLREISGMVATDDGYVVINDGADDEARRRIFFLDQRCTVVRTVSFRPGRATPRTWPSARTARSGSPTSATTTAPGRRSPCGGSHRGRRSRCCTG